MELRGRVWLGVVVGRVLPLLVLLSVALAARSAPPATARAASSVLHDGHVCARGLRERALQHVQRGHHGALFDLARLVLMRRGAVVVVSRRHLQSLGLKLKLELSGLGLGLMLACSECSTSAFHYCLLLAQRVLLLGMGVHFMVLWML